MEVILREDVPNVGRIGDLVKVADGFARNYLIPRKLAVVASKRSLKQLEHEKQKAVTKKVRLLKDAESVREALEKASCKFARQVAEGERLFGSVSAKDITDDLERKGFSIEKRQVVLERPIKELGVYDVEIRLLPDVQATLKVWVVAEEEAS